MLSETGMPRKTRGQLFGVFDEQAVSVLVALNGRHLKFSKLIQETGLSKASLSRVVLELERSQVIQKSDEGYLNTSRGKEVVSTVLRIAEEVSSKMMTKVTERLHELMQDYRVNGRVFHNNSMWERTCEKVLIEVMAMKDLTGVQSLLFQQKFQEEARFEEQWLRRSPIAR